MKDLITNEHKVLLWQDECGDQFLILKYTEVFKYSDNLLRLHCWSFKFKELLKTKGLIVNERKPDDPLFIIDVKIENLFKLLRLDTIKKRMGKTSKKLLKLEKVLAHKIIPYRPKLVKIEQEELIAV